MTLPPTHNQTPFIPHPKPNNKKADMARGVFAVVVVAAVLACVAAEVRIRVL